MMRRWLVGVLAATGIGCLAAGAALTFPILTRNPVAEAEPEGPPVHVKNESPEKLGWPVYPGAFDFGTAVDEEGNGSTSYSVRKGSSEEVVRFYQEKLAAKGWKQRSNKRVKMGPGTAPTDPQYSGRRVIWRRENPKQTATLIVLDYPESRRFTAHILLTWKPADPQPASGTK